MSAVPSDRRRVLRALAGKPCWHVSAGPGVGSTFQLALGAKVPRARPLANPAQPAAYRKFEGECALMVWCAWRLDGARGPVVSSDAKDVVVDRLLTRALRGRTVERARITVPLAWDLEVAFDRGLVLRVFCDHLPGDPSFDGNYEVVLPDRELAVGPGKKWEVVERSRA
ncbi:MAG: hypothetical protein KIT58_01190 [Planctomycetota bacterium]|nr:hypothetical protein [Planctomycetota bacterium]